MNKLVKDLSKMIDDAVEEKTKKLEKENQRLRNIIIKYETEIGYPRINKVPQKDN